MVDLVTGIVLLSLLAGALWRPPVAYAAVVVTFALEQWAQAGGSFFATNPQVLNYAVGIIVLAGIGSALMQGRQIFSNIEFTYIGVLALYAICALSAMWSVSTPSTISVFSYTAPYLITYSLALPLVFNTEKDFVTALVALMLVSLFLVPALLFGTTIHDWGRTIETSIEVVDRYGRTRTRLTPLAVASYAAVVCLTAATAHLGKTSQLLRYCSLLVLPLAMFMIVRSGSRGQFVATVAAGLAFIKFSYPGLNFGRLMAGGVAAAFFGGIAYLTIAVLTGETTRFSIEGAIDDYLGTRVVYCSTMISEWLNSSPLNLVFGLGSSASWHFLGTYPHVQLIELIVELGVIGVAVAIFILANSSYSLWRSLKLTRRDIKLRGAVVAFASFATLDLILSFKQGSFLTNYSLYFNLIILAKFSVISAREKSHATQVRRQELMRRYQAPQGALT